MAGCFFLLGHLNQMSHLLGHGSRLLLLLELDATLVGDWGPVDSAAFEPASSCTTRGIGAGPFCCFRIGAGVFISIIT